MSSPQERAPWTASRRACRARLTAASAVALVAGLLVGCTQSASMDGDLASRTRDSETIKPAGYINPDAASTEAPWAP